MTEKIEYQLFDNGDAAITIQYNTPIGEQLTTKIMQSARFLRGSFSNVLIEVIPAYQSLTLVYNPLKISNKSFKEKLTKLLAMPHPELTLAPKEITIPVCYDEEFAPDLGALSDYCKLSVEDVIQYHCANAYLVYMLGFLPGFLYLGDLNKKLHCPRKQTPRIQVAAGSVAIGGKQTGLYPVDSPGGWHIIGRTPIKTFKPHPELSFIASPLDRIKFAPISRKRFHQLRSEQDEY